MAWLIRDARLQVIPGGGHLFVLEQPAAIAAQVRRIPRPARHESPNTELGQTHAPGAGRSGGGGSGRDPRWSSNAEFAPPPGRDAVSILEQQAILAGPEFWFRFRYERMLVSPFTYLRGGGCGDGRRPRRDADVRADDPTVWRRRTC